MFDFRNTALTVFAVSIANPQGIHSLPKRANRRPERDEVAQERRARRSGFGYLLPDVGLVISLALLVMIFIGAAMNRPKSDSQRGS